MSSETYPQLDEELGNILIGFDGIDWDYYNVHGLIAELKEAVPKDNRDYDPQKRRWAIDAKFKHVLQGLVDRYFG